MPGRRMDCRQDVGLRIKKQMRQVSGYVGLTVSWLRRIHVRFCRRQLRQLVVKVSR
jgi:hypothetical protein